MVNVDENLINDWLYKIISMVESEPDMARKELINLSSYVINAPRSDGNQRKGNYVRPSIR